MYFRMLCGRRVRVELSSGKSRSSYRPPPRYNSEERCYECGERGHYARDCKGSRRRSRQVFYLYKFVFKVNSKMY